MMESAEKQAYTREEQEELFEEELKKSQASVSVDFEDASSCRYCERLMSDMRKFAVRWLYMEWYKKAVLGLNLPTEKPFVMRERKSNLKRWKGRDDILRLYPKTTSINLISELTPTLGSGIKDRYSTRECRACTNSLEYITEETLKPMKTLSELYSLPNRDVAGGSSEANVEMEKENQTLAASFFVRAAQKLNLSSKSKQKKSKRRKDEENNEPGYTFCTNFSELIMRQPPNAPTSLFKHGTIKRADSHGKVRLFLRVVEKRQNIDKCISIDAKKKQVMLHERGCDVNEPNRRLEKAPRLFAFDNIYDKYTSQSELCSSTLVELLQSVVNGNDACLLTYGYPKLGKSSIMVGRDDSPENIGLIPCAISWLYQLIDDRKQRTGARFSIRVSAVEVVGKSENLKDLLGEQGNGSVSSNATSPSIYLPRERAGAVQLSDFTELRAPNPEKAAFYFDAAVTARTRASCSLNKENDEDNDEMRNSSMLFTLHVYQYMIDKVGTGEIHGGRSRFHLIDLSGCSRKKRSRDTGQGSWLPLSALGNVIVSLSNGAKHVPHRDSKLTTLLREAMGSISARITMITNVSADMRHCPETLATLQVASRIHRSRKKKSRYSSTSSSGGDSSCDEKRKHKRRCRPVQPLLRTEACQSDNLGESEFNSTSAAEESCDTVIYLGPSGGALSDRELTDFEHPPPLFNEQKQQCSNTLTRRKPSSVVAAEQNKKSKENEKNEKPIIVNMKSNTLPRRSTLELKADQTFSPKKPSFVESNNNNSQAIDLNSSQQNAPSKNFCDTSPSKTFSETSPRNYRSCSLKIQDQTDSYEHSSFTTFHPGDRQCFSNDSSPCKRGRTVSQVLTLENRAASLDRALLRKEKSLSENDPAIFRSTDTVSSNGTVENFERELVSQIAERFALEDEFEYVHQSQGQEFFIDDDFADITAGLECSSPIDNLQTVITPLHSIENTEQRENTVIPCNHCVGSCLCPSRINKDHRIHQECYDSAEDFDEPMDKRLASLKNRSSYSSCDSQLDGTNYKHRPPSEGVSSGYESMRCESSANIHISSMLDIDRRKEKIIDPDLHHKTIYEIVDENNFHDELKYADKKKLVKAAQYRSQIKELIEKRQDLKEELHQTLKKLVLNKVPLPDIDERLRQISMQSKDSKRLLTRENRILERKVRVCKSHLKIVNSMETNTQKKKKQDLAQLEKKSKYQKFSSKIKSKLTKTTSPTRQPYKVTSV